MYGNADPKTRCDVTRPPLLVTAMLSILLTGIVSGCVLEPINGDTFSSSNVGRTITFEGFATEPGASMTIDVLDPPEQDPHDAASTWRQVAQTYASASAVYWTSDDPLYEFEVQATIVASAADGYLWPEGGVVRLRVQQNGQGAITFDDAGCIGENLFEPVDTIALNCASHDSGVLTLVDTDPVFDPDLDFIARKETSASEADDYYRAVDAGPNDLRFTLGGWKEVNGFEASFYQHTGLIDLSPFDDDDSIRLPDLDGSSPLLRSAGTGSLSPIEARRELAEVNAAELDTQRLAANGFTAEQETILGSTGLSADLAARDYSSIQQVGSPHQLVAAYRTGEARLAAQSDASLNASIADILAASAPPLHDDVSAIYRNAGDLGFGREMHCRQREDGATACYVTNYGDPETPARDSLADAIAHRNPVATVAMEYLPTASSNKVRFYVYDGFGRRLEEAALDSQGAKSVPGVCLACHQGSYDPTTDVVKGARFLPFDVQSFEYTTEPGYTRSEQEEAFRKLNRIVLETNATVATADLIEGWYGPAGIYTAGTLHDSDYVPAGWSSQPTLYSEVVKPYCRMCHVAKGGGSGLDFRDFASFEALGPLIGLRVCGDDASRTMPQAEVTYDAFWSGSGRAHLVGALGLATSCVAD